MAAVEEQKKRSRSIIDYSQVAADTYIHICIWKSSCRFTIFIFHKIHITTLLFYRIKFYY